MARRQEAVTGQPIPPDAPATFEQAGVTSPDGTEISPDTPEYEQLVFVIENVNDELLRMIRRNPAIMRSLTPRQFEEVVAELLTRLGYHVELTPPSKDGGFDMAVAKRSNVGSFLYLVECKRYQPSHKVGVELVRSLYGVVENHKATGGVLVTTSFFTKGARELQAALQHRMDLRDYTRLQEWLWCEGGAAQSH